MLCHIARREVWEPVVDWLAGAHRVTFVDVPGFGSTPLPPGLPPSVESMARGVVHELGVRGLENSHVVGVSVAGSVALEVARLGGAGTVTALSPAGFWSTREAVQISLEIGSLWASVRLARPLVVAAGKVPIARAMVWDRITAHPDHIPLEVADRLILGLPANMHHLTDDPRVALRWLRAVASYRVRPLDGSIPVTVAWGDRDTFLPYKSHAARAREVLPHARHVTLRGCGHLPTYDDPEQVARVILEATARG